MSNLEYWDDIEGLGTFQLEMELVVSTEPVLFVCKKDEERYLFMTYNSYEGVFVFCKINTDNLIRMLKNEITMDKAFRSAEFICQTYVDEKGIMHFKQYEAKSFDGSMLPRQGAYYRISSKYIQDYVSELIRENDECLPYEYGRNIPVNNGKFVCTIKTRTALAEWEGYNSLADIIYGGIKEFANVRYQDFSPQFEECYTSMVSISNEDINNTYVA